MRCFPRLLDRQRYKPAIFDLSADPAQKEYWVEVFKLNMDDVERIVREHRDGLERERAAQAGREFRRFLDELGPEGLAAHPHVHAWSVVRDEVLRKHGLDDPYREVKEAENRKALALLPSELARLSSMDDPAMRMREIVLNMFAGNLFDLGSAVTARAHRHNGLVFQSLMERIRRKAWFMDDLDSFLRWLGDSPGPREVLFLADNAGPDFLCGCIPFAVELIEYDAVVTIALNQRPALNDVTCDEGVVLLDAVSRVSPRCAARLREGRLKLISSGASTAGIDLRLVSDEMAELAGRIDLLILEGQGRAVETNWHARFDVPCLRVSTIKDEQVARHLGASVYDMIFSFDR